MKSVMKRGWKRICAVILAAAMTLTMLPVGVQAEDEKKKFTEMGLKMANTRGLWDVDR